MKQLAIGTVLACQKAEDTTATIPVGKPTSYIALVTALLVVSLDGPASVVG
jgi:hypothetical protein